MKAKEKGIAQRDLRRGTPSTDRGTPAPGERDANGTSKKFQQSNGIKFNAFREMDKMSKGGVPSLAKIPDTVAVIGKPLNFPDSGKKRAREEEADDKPKKAAKVEVGAPSLDGNVKLIARSRSFSNTEAQSWSVTASLAKSWKKRRFPSIMTRLSSSLGLDRTLIGRISR